jgi:hypothetical protein
MIIREITAAKPPTPEQQRIKALQAQAKRARDAVKAERARQKIKKAQSQLASIETSTNM